MHISNFAKGGIVSTAFFSVLLFCTGGFAQNQGGGGGGSQNPMAMLANADADINAMLDTENQVECTDLFSIKLLTQRELSNVEVTPVKDGTVIGPTQSFSSIEPFWKQINVELNAPEKYFRIEVSGQDPDGNNVTTTLPLERDCDPEGYSAGNGITIVDRVISADIGEGLEYGSNSQIKVDSGPGIEMTPYGVGVDSSDDTLGVGGGGVFVRLASPSGLGVTPEGLRIFRDRDQLSFNSASELDIARGGVTSREIADGAITGDDVKMGNGLTRNPNTGAIRIKGDASIDVNSWGLSVGRISWVELEEDSVEMSEFKGTDDFALSDPTDPHSRIKIADGAITSDELADGTISGDDLKLGDGITRHPDTGAIRIKTDATISSSSWGLSVAQIGSGQLREGSVELAELHVTDDFELSDPNDPHSRVQIAQGAITRQKLDHGSVSRDKLVNGAVTRYKLDEHAVSPSKIMPDAIRAKHIHPGCPDEGDAFRAIGGDVLGDSDFDYSALPKCKNVGLGGYCVDGDGQTDSVGTYCDPSTYLDDGANNFDGDDVFVKVRRGHDY